MTSKVLVAKLDDRYTFIITTDDKGCRLSVEPAYRHNGTQSFDGRFPRFYTSPRYAKSALTKFLGEAVIWQESVSS